MLLLRLCLSQSVVFLSTGTCTQLLDTASLLHTRNGVGLCCLAKLEHARRAKPPPHLLLLENSGCLCSFVLFLLVLDVSKFQTFDGSFHSCPATFHGPKQQHTWPQNTCLDMLATGVQAVSSGGDCCASLPNWACCCCVEYWAKHIPRVQVSIGSRILQTLSSLTDLWLACGAKPPTLGSNKVERVHACVLFMCHRPMQLGVARSVGRGVGRFVYTLLGLLTASSCSCWLLFIYSFRTCMEPRAAEAIMRLCCAMHGWFLFGCVGCINMGEAAVPANHQNHMSATLMFFAPHIPAVVCILVCCCVWQCTAASTTVPLARRLFWVVLLLQTGLDNAGLSSSTQGFHFGVCRGAGISCTTLSLACIAQNRDCVLIMLIEAQSCG
jgi:hypothetical protein